MNAFFAVRFRSKCQAVVLLVSFVLFCFFFRKGHSLAFIPSSRSPTVFDIHLPFVSHFISIHLHFIYFFISPSTTLLSTYQMRYCCEQHFGRTNGLLFAYSKCKCFFRLRSLQSLCVPYVHPCDMFIICYFSYTCFFAPVA